MSVNDTGYRIEPPAADDEDAAVTLRDQDAPIVYNRKIRRGIETFGDDFG